MSSIVALVAPLAFLSSPTPEPAAYDQAIRLTGGVGAVVETRSWADDQTMATWSFTPSLRWDRLVVGFEAALRTTGHNDQKLDLGARVGAAFDLSSAWDATTTFDLGWRRQTKSRFDGKLGDDKGIDREHGYAGVTLGFHHHGAGPDAAFVYGFETYARIDLAGKTRVEVPDDSPVNFGGTIEVGIAFKIGLDAILGQ